MNYWSHSENCENWRTDQCFPGCKSECLCKAKEKKCLCDINDGKNFNEYYSVGKKNDFFPLSVISFTESKKWFFKLFRNIFSSLIF